jgi:hypothetical protein
VESKTGAADSAEAEVEKGGIGAAAANAAREANAARIVLGAERQKARLDPDERKRLEAVFADVTRRAEDPDEVDPKPTELRAALGAARKLKRDDDRREASSEEAPE